VGLFDKFIPKFVKQYAQIRPIILEALSKYKQEVQDAVFPSESHSFTMPDQALEDLKKLIES